MRTPPLHERIRSQISADILEGRLRPGERLPSEAELMDIWGCARMTVSKALSALTEAGMLERRKRAGTFVAAPRAQSMVLAVPDLGAEIAARGAAYQWEILRRTALNGAAKLDTAGPVLRIEGLHRADGLAIAHEDRLINLGEVPEAASVDFALEAPGAWLLGHVPWTRAENRIGACAATPPLAKSLGITGGAACLWVERRTWRGAGSVTRVRQTFVGDRYELVARF